MTGSDDYPKVTDLTRAWRPAAVRVRVDSSGLMGTVVKASDSALEA